jgi:hypothetical protein
MSYDHVWWLLQRKEEGNDYQVRNEGKVRNELGSIQRRGLCVDLLSQKTENDIPSS